VLVAERRSVSRASIEDGTVVTTLAQIVAMGTLPNVSTSATPFADASLLFMGAAGALLIGAGSVIAMTGKNMGTVLTGSRVLFALAENGDRQKTESWFFGAIHGLL
jgi:amino acid transporter